MFQNKTKKPVQRTVTSKSTSRGKNSKKQLIEIVYTDTTNLKTYKAKSQCLSRQKIQGRKSIDVSRITKKSLSQKTPLKKYKDFPYQENKISPRKNTGLEKNIQKHAQLRWNKKRPLSKKNEGKSNQKQKLSWNEKKAPFDWESVITEYPHLLTRYELSQIKEYKKIYYIGHKAKKKQRIDFFETNFDNEEKQYNFIMNDHIAYRYQVLGVVGKGSYGQVFKVFDHKKKQQMALKMVKNRTKFNKQAFIEIRILTHIKEKDCEQSSNVVRIKDFVIFRKHVCIVFELLSENLYELIIRNNYNGLNTQLIRRFAIQILTSLDFMKKNKIIHCDLKPENILLREYSKSGIKIIDLGSSCFQNQTIYTYIQSRYYRAPEITLGIEYDTRIDVWSAGCIFAELYTGVPLFPGQNQEEQMKYFIDTLGLPPKQMLQKGSRVDVFFNNKSAIKKEILQLKTIQYFSKHLQERIPQNNFRQFVSKFLKWNPKDRITPIEALKCDWIQEGIPQHLRNTQTFQKTEQQITKSSTVFKVKTKSREKKKLSVGKN